MKRLIPILLILFYSTAYSAGFKDYDAETTPVDGDILIMEQADSSATNYITFANVVANYLDALYASVLGADDNYVTDAEKVVIGNTSGTNTGDDAADDTAYNATSWDANTDAATKNAIRDKIESMGGGSGDILANGTVPMTADWSFGAFDITGGVDSTWSGQGSFGTITSGATGFTVDADGDVVAKSFTTAATSTPGITLEDDDDAAGTATIYANSSGGANDVILSIGVEDSGGEDQAYIEVDGVTETVDFLENTTLQAGDIITADLAADAVEGTKIADNAVDTEHLADDAVTYAEADGSSKSLTPVTDDADDFAAAFTGSDLYGGTFVANLAGDVDLPAPVIGMHFTVITLGDIEVDILPTAGDDLILDGVQLDDNHDASNTGSAGDIIVVQYYDADGWICTSNGWTEVAD